jgi:NTP pyrophosphatase (non-canonical NTP hydrolase)
MADSETTIFALRDRIESFVRAREWETFHNPKDLALGISIEAAELMEVFLWKDPRQVDELIQRQEALDRVVEELADILILCLSLANRLGIDVADAVAAKVAANEAKYPAERVRGKADKYTYYDKHV